MIRGFVFVSAACLLPRLSVIPTTHVHCVWSVAVLTVLLTCITPVTHVHCLYNSNGTCTLRVCIDRLACLLQVQFEVCDATKCKYAAETFDVIYSRDTILHIDDKRDLFTKFLVSMFTF